MGNTLKAKTATVVAAIRTKTTAIAVGTVATVTLAAPAIASASSYTATSTTPPGDIGTKTNTILGYLTWGGGLCCVIGLLTIGAMMALSHHNGRGAGEHVSKIGAVAGAAVLIGAAVSLVSALM